MRRYLRTAAAFLFVFIIAAAAVFTMPKGLNGAGMTENAGTADEVRTGAEKTEKENTTEDASADARAENTGKAENAGESSGEKSDTSLTHRLFCTVLGDSIAKGYSGDKSATIQCYGQIAAEEIASEEGKRYTLRNYARNGLASEGLNEKVLTRSQVLMDLEKSDLILITIGSNDLLNECKNMVQDILKTDTKFKSADEALAVLEDAVKSNPFLIIRIIDALSDWDYHSFEIQWMKSMDVISTVRREGVPVIVTDIYNPVVNMKLPSTMNQVVEDIIGNMNSIIEEHAGEYNYSVARVSESTICAHVQDDGLHPDQMGQQIIAELVTEQYRSAEQ